MKGPKFLQGRRQAHRDMVQYGRQFVLDFANAVDGEFPLDYFAYGYRAYAAVC